MVSLQEKYSGIINNYLKWLDVIKKFEVKMILFETESSDFQIKVDDLVMQFVFLVSDSSTQSVNSGFNNSYINKFMTNASCFCKNMISYYDKKIVYANLNTEYSTKLVDSQKDLNADDLKLLINNFLSIEKLYVPKINEFLVYFMNNLSLLKKQFNNLKSEYNKIVQ